MELRILTEEERREKVICDCGKRATTVDNCKIYRCPKCGEAIRLAQKIVEVQNEEGKREE